MEDIVAENAELRDIQMQNLKNHADKVSDNTATQGPISSEIIAEMNDRIDILMAENAAMVEQKGSLSMEIEGLQSELEARTSEVETLSERLSTTTRELKNCAVQGVQTERERDEAAKEAVAMSDSLGRMDGEMSSLREQLVMWQQKCTDAETTIADMKKEVSSAVDHSNASALSSMRRVKAADDRVKEVQSQMMKKSVELDTAQELARKLKREYQSTRQDAEGMLQVMSGLERQINEYSGREAEVEARDRKCREDVETAFTERDQAVARADQNKREIERLQEERKKFHESRQADMEAAADAARARSMEQVRTCEAEMAHLAETLSKLQMDTERAVREGKGAKEMMESKERTIEDERRNYEDALKDLRDRLSVAIINRDEEASKKVDIQEANKELRGVVDKLRLDIDSMQIQINTTERSRLADVSALKAANRELSKELTDKNRLLSRKALETDEVREEWETKATDLERRVEDEGRLYRQRVADAEKAVRVLLYYCSSFFSCL
jgi:chromosome segregation ATPase